MPHHDGTRNSFTFCGHKWSYQKQGGEALVFCVYSVLQEPCNQSSEDLINLKAYILLVGLSKMMVETARPMWFPACHVRGTNKLFPQQTTPLLPCGEFYLRDGTNPKVGCSCTSPIGRRDAMSLMALQKPRRRPLLFHFRSNFKTFSICLQHPSNNNRLPYHS